MSTPPPSDSTESWAAFQRRFLDVLAEHTRADAIQQSLAQEELSDPQRLWLKTMQPEMLETAAALVKKWGERDAT